MSEHTPEQERREPRLSKVEITAIADAVKTAMLPEICAHADDHEWVRSQRQAAAARTRFWEKMLEHITRWGILGALSAAGYALWLGSRDWLIAALHR